MSLFAVNREAGPAWMDGTGAFDQPGAGDHAAFMNGLAEEGFILAAGPLAGTESGRIRVLLDRRCQQQDGDRSAARRRPVGAHGADDDDNDRAVDALRRHTLEARARTPRLNRTTATGDTTGVDTNRAMRSDRWPCGEWRGHTRARVDTAENDRGLGRTSPRLGAPFVRSDVDRLSRLRRCHAAPRDRPSARAPVRYPVSASCKRGRPRPRTPGRGRSRPPDTAPGRSRP